MEHSIAEVAAVAAAAAAQAERHQLEARKASMGK